MPLLEARAQVLLWISAGALGMGVIVGRSFAGNGHPGRVAAGVLGEDLAELEVLLQLDCADTATFLSIYAVEVVASGLYDDAAALGDLQEAAVVDGTLGRLRVAPEARRAGPHPWPLQKILVDRAIVGRVSVWILRVGRARLRGQRQLRILYLQIEFRRLSILPRGTQQVAKARVVYLLLVCHTVRA